MESQKWPSVEEQLAVAKVAHGSALEQLIKNNQDDSLLRPEESMNDNINYPLWLRVYYRKQHPDEKKSSAGAAGDYPDVLENLHEWMKIKQDLPPNPAAWIYPERNKTEGGHYGN